MSENHISQLVNHPRRNRLIQYQDDRNAGRVGSIPASQVLFKAGITITHQLSTYIQARGIPGSHRDDVCIVAIV